MGFLFGKKKSETLVQAEHIAKVQKISQLLDKNKTNQIINLVLAKGTGVVGGSYSGMYTEEAVKASLQAIQSYKKQFPWNGITQLVAVHCFLLKGIRSEAALSEFGVSATTEEINLIWNRLNSFRQLLEFRDTGIKTYKVSSCGDRLVCKKCKQMDRKSFPVAKAVVGETAPPFCEKCRCIMTGKI